MADDPFFMARVDLLDATHYIDVARAALSDGLKLTATAALRSASWCLANAFEKVANEPAKRRTLPIGTPAALDPSPVSTPPGEG